MSDSSTSRPVSLVTILFIFLGFALFLLAAWYVYQPRQTGAFTDDGIRTAEQRKKTLNDLRDSEAKLVNTYGWVDQKTGVVRLPIDRAMELTAQQYAKK